MKLGQLLTIAVVVIVSISLMAPISLQFVQNRSNYAPYMRYSLSRIPLRYDYSCDESVYGLYLVLNNSGLKVVQNLSLSITNQLCVGAIPPVPDSLLPGQTLKVYLYSTAQNGTITIRGNETEVLIQF